MTPADRLRRTIARVRQRVAEYRKAGNKTLARDYVEIGDAAELLAAYDAQVKTPAPTRAELDRIMAAARRAREEYVLQLEFLRRLLDEKDTELAALRRKEEPKATEPMFYIQNTGSCGNCIKFWRVDGKGYTLDLEEAWKVTETEAKSICQSRPEEDIPIPADLIERASRRHVNIERLNALRRTEE